MPPDTTETEVKLRFPGPEEALRRLGRIGAIPASPRRFEDNVLYDRPDGALSAADRLLRVRRIGGRTVLTFKGPSEPGGRHKVRVEHETAVDDPGALARILDELGLRPAWRYQKYRTTLQLGDLLATVDETPIGCFVELEGPPTAIDDAAARLGFSPADYLTGTYHDLYEAHCAREGRPPGDLVF